MPPSKRSSPICPNEEESGGTRLESFLKFLIDRGFVDNEDDSTETIHRFLQIFEQFEIPESLDGERNGDDEAAADVPDDQDHERRARKQQR